MILFYVLGDTRREVLDEYVLLENVDGRTGFKCKLCGKINTHRYHTLNHVESVHFPSSFNYECNICGKQYNSKNSLNVHVSTKHRNQNKC